MAQERPELPVIAITPNYEIACRLNLVWGVRTYIDGDVFGSFDNIEAVSRKFAYQSGFVKAGDFIVLTAGYPFGKVGLTNVLHIVKA
jgi:pyruvate kinase